MMNAPANHAQTAPVKPLADPVAEARRVIGAADGHGVTMRALGGVAVFLQAPEAKPLLGRDLHDIDLVAPKESKRALEPVMSALGYASDENFNAYHGHHRQLYVDLHNRRRLDVFVGSFSMCHELPIAGRLERHPLTVPLAELLLTKLQIVELNERDERDVYNLCFHHPISDTEPDGIEAGFVAGLCADDWGLWRTCTGTIERCRRDLGNYGLSDADRSLIDGRLAELADRIETAPKGSRWRRRSRLGERKRWYQEPEEE